jgi:hypothetical protein
MKLKETNIFVINGHPRVGKDFLVNKIREVSINQSVLNYSTVSVVKEMAELIGYEENVPSVKNNFRAFLSDLKDLIDSHFEKMTVKTCIQKAIDKHEEKLSYEVFSPIIFIHSREPENIDCIKSYAKEKGYKIRTLLVMADWVVEKEEYSNHADKNIGNYDYDYLFLNTKNESLFYKRMLDFIKKNTNLN